ncbi:MAG: FAD-dependent oxidoreductase [Proteobacteria bacterium]|nr:MAG: FAD-dependent oxidoreductase [Pseudomonadota bacterium]
MAQDVLIVGGGIAGVMAAYNLNKLGENVTIVDKGDLSDNTSFGNAGLLSAWEKPPLSHPGVIGDTLKLMVQGKSPLIINPTLDLNVYKWLLKFVASSSRSRLKKSLILFEKYGDLNLREYLNIIKKENADFDLHQDGVYLVFTNKQNYLTKLTQAKDTQKYEVLSYEEARDNMGFVKDNIEGVINLKRNVRLDPKCVMESMYEILRKRGVKFILNEEIVDWELENGKIKKAVGKNQSYKSDTFILASGIDTKLASKVGTNLMLTPAKGYNITFQMDESIKPKQCVMFGDLFIICTPRKNDVRLTSKLELATKDKEVMQKRIRSIVNTLKNYTIDFEMKNPSTWAGFRPLTPNDMPLIGRDENYKNLVYAMGYGWLGMTFGGALGRIIADLIHRDLDNKQSDDIMLFSGFYQGCL